jgi:hypothetical protein
MGEDCLVGDMMKEKPLLSYMWIEIKYGQFSRLM